MQMSSVAVQRRCQAFIDNNKIEGARPCVKIRLIGLDDASDPRNRAKYSTILSPWFRSCSHPIHIALAIQGITCGYFPAFALRLPSSRSITNALLYWFDNKTCLL
jgi:hypothetical protein